MTGEPMGEVACSYWLPRRGHVPRRMALDAAASVFLFFLPIRPVTRETEAERSRGALGGDEIWPWRRDLRRGEKSKGGAARWQRASSFDNHGLSLRRSGGGGAWRSRAWPRL